MRVNHEDAAMTPRVFLSLDGQNVKGPFTTEDLRGAVSRNEIAKTTLACEEGSETWQPLGDLRPEAFGPAGKPLSVQIKGLLAYLAGTPDKASKTLLGRVKRASAILVFASLISAAGLLLLILLTSLLPSLKASLGMAFINGLLALVLVTSIGLVKALLGR
jgi:hypothetical protein